MPVSYSLSESILEVTMEGRTTTEEGLAAFEQGLASIPSGAKYGVLIDVTRSEEVKSFGDFKQIAALFGEHADSLGGRIGVLVAHQVRFGTARQFGALVECHGLEALPFEDRDAAVAWLVAAR